MKAIFWRTIKDRRIVLLIYCLGVIGFLWMYVGMFPSFADKKDEFNQLMQYYPKEMMQAFGITEITQIFSSIENFLAMEQFSIVWPIVVIALAVSIGGSSIAGEIEAGTIETLLELPISRVKIFFAKYLGGLVLIAVFTVVSVFTVIPLAAAYHVDYQASHYVTTFIIGLLFAWAIMTLAFFFSVVFNSKGRAYFIPVGILILMYVLKIISSLKENLKDLQYTSFFYYFDANKSLINNKIDNWSYLIFGGVIIVFTIIAVFWFSKRDIVVS
ncbi:ABC transporter permease [Patescibacteria group bacterium]|nr:ABC transporter permease [Patescibacteria group bacterium]